MPTAYLSGVTQRRAWRARSSQRLLRAFYPSETSRPIKTALATLALTFVYVLTGMPTATTPTANLPGGTHIQSTSESLVLACGGQCSGLCPCPSGLSNSGMASV